MAHSRFGSLAKRNGGGLFLLVGLKKCLFAQASLFPIKYYHKTKPTRAFIKEFIYKKKKKILLTKGGFLRSMIKTKTKDVKTWLICTLFVFAYHLGSGGADWLALHLYISRLKFLKPFFHIELTKRNWKLCGKTKKGKRLPREASLHGANRSGRLAQRSNFIVI